MSEEAIRRLDRPTREHKMQQIEEDTLIIHVQALPSIIDYMWF